MSLYIACMALGAGISIGATIVFVFVSSFTRSDRAQGKRREFIRQEAAKIFTQLITGSEDLGWELARSIAVREAKELWREIEDSERPEP